MFTVFAHVVAQNLRLIMRGKKMKDKINRRETAAAAAVKDPDN